MPSTNYRTGCAALVIALLGSLLGCETPRTDAQKQVDKEIADRVDNALQADHQLYAKHIIVRANNGVVQLTGYVWESPDLLEAQRVAEGVQGVAQVVNDLELQRNGLGDSPVSR
ncbi:MAG TPA: BON domain-containing protein [Steroidobacteraceae bacterium]|nr:BON domain-containing protein [Steroidobacteraceae bacterium]